ncbi:MAG: DNA repair protein RecN, partial [Peptococcaceae bacterium]|nr:DNA repair protein RecN [Peptococcaceae bacterium]
MLVRLRVKDFALIHQIELELNPHFNVLTGETGAGKSIIIDAVSLLLGARANNKDIRIGCEKAIVEGTFTVESVPEIDAQLAEYGYELDDDRELILYREMSANGKNICRINDRSVTLSTFRQIGQLLINIYGQHDFQAISNKEHHLALLDALGDAAFVQKKQQMAEAYRVLSQIMQKRNALEQSLKERGERLEFLQFKLHELQELHLQNGEFEALEQELAVLDNYEKIASVAEFAHQALYDDRKSVYAILTAVVEKLNSVQQYDKQFAEMAAELQNMLYLAEDYGMTLSGYGSKMDFEEEKRDRLNERKYTLDKAIRKYHLSIDELIEEQQKLQLEVNQLENADTEIEELNRQYLAQRAIYEEIALQVRAMRKTMAEQLEYKLLQELAQLSMEHTRFAVHFADKHASAQGMDEVEFYMSANPGQPLRALSEIASGGEMSRIMLAFKTVLAQNEHIG